jgi:hypothetical protein
MNTDDPVGDLLLRWEEAFEQGRDIPAEELSVERPELVETLRERIKSLKQLRWVTRSVEDLPEGSQPPSPETTTVLAGRYRLDALIGEGGFGRVWRGFDLQLKRHVAVKLPRPDRLRIWSGGEDVFLTEARKLAQLTDPGIVAVYDVGRHEDTYFIISEFIDGYDLARRVRAGPLPVREAVRFVSDAARHLHVAHRQGFIHRDVKPANLLVGWHGRLLVADFGIAIDGSETEIGGGIGSGTLAYMAPERLFADASRIDARADVYSLGIVLYELLTGRVPFVGDTPEKVCQAIRDTEPTSPRSLNRSIPRSIERVCLRCLAKSPVNRFPTAHELSVELGRHVGHRSRSVAVVAICILVLGLGIGLLVSQLRPEKPNDAVPVAANAPPDNGGVKDARTLDTQAAVSPLPEWLSDEVKLFNGQDLTGWLTHGMRVRYQGDEPTEGAFVKGGELICRDSPDYWLQTEDRYSDFRLRFGYRFPRPPRWATGSTVMLRMNGPGWRSEAHWHIHFGGWATGRVLPPLMGLLPSPVGYEPFPGLWQAERPIGEWNELEITCVGLAVAIRVNGVFVHDEFPIGKGQGHIGFAPLGNEMQLRNIRVRKIVR